MKNDDILKWKRLVESVNAMAEDESEHTTNSHTDHEVSMAKTQLLTAVKSATRIAKSLSSTTEEEGIDGWIASKITLAQDYLQTVADYMEGEKIRESVETDTPDTVTMDVPLLIRIMEYAREDAKDDMDLHSAAEKMIALSKNGNLSMDDYDNIINNESDLEEKQGCWDGYKRDYSKKKFSDGSCVKEEVTLDEGQDFHEEFGFLAYDEDGLFEAEYQGRTVQLNKPMRGDVKKFKVYVKNDKGNVVKVNFGDPDMKIKKSNPERQRVLEQDIIAITQDQKQKQDIGHVKNGETEKALPIEQGFTISLRV